MICNFLKSDVKGGYELEFRKAIFGIFLNPVLYVKVMLTVMLLIDFPYIGDAAKFIIKIVLIWGGMIVALNFEKILGCLKTKRNKFLLFMICSYCITCLINYRYHLLQNFKAMMWFILYIGLLLSWWRFSGKKDIFKDIEQINWIVIIINLLNVIPSVFMYLLSISIWFQDRPIGICATRLFGVMAGLNSSVMIAWVSSLASVFNYKIDDNNRKVKKILYFVNIVCSYIFLIASGTRAVRLNMIIMLTFCYLILKWKKWSMHNWYMNKFKFVMRSGIIGCVAFFIIGGTVELSKYPISLLPLIFGGSTVIRDKGTEERSTENRLQIWEECIELWEEHPIMGIGNANIKVYADLSKKKFQYINVSPYGVSTHGLPVALLVYSGIVGTVIFAIYLVMRMISGFIGLMGELKLVGKRWNSMFFGFMICVSLCIHSVFGTIIIFSNVENTILFWVYLGLMEFSEEDIRCEENLLSKNV